MTKYLSLLGKKVGNLIERLPFLSVSILNGIVLLLNIVVSLVLVRYLPKEAYGQIVYFQAGVGLVRLLANLGLGSYITREIAALHSDSKERARLLYHIISSRLIVMCILYVIVIVVNTISPQQFLHYIVLTGFIASIADIGTATLAGLRNLVGVAFATMLQSTFYGLLVILFIVFEQVQPDLLMLFSAVSLFAAGVVTLVFIVSTKQIGKPSFRDFDIRKTPIILANAIPLYLHSIFSYSYISLNSGALGARGDFIASANYGAAFNLIIMTLMLSAGALLNVFLPQITQLTAAGDRASLLKQIRDVVTLSLRIYLFISVLIAAFPETIVSILFGAQYERSAVYLLSLAPVPVILSLSSLFTQVLISQHRQWLAVLGLGAQSIALLIAVNTTVEMTAALLVEATLISSLFGALLLIGVTVWALKALPFRWVDAAAVGLALISALVLRQVQIAVGVELSLWHFAAGAAFLLVYGAVWVITEKIQWRAPSHSS